MESLRHTQPTLFKQVSLGHIVTPLSLLLTTRKKGNHLVHTTLPCHQNQEFVLQVL